MYIDANPVGHVQIKWSDSTGSTVVVNLTRTDDSEWRHDIIATKTPSYEYIEGAIEHAFVDSKSNQGEANIQAPCNADVLLQEWKGISQSFTWRLHSGSWASLPSWLKHGPTCSRKQQKKNECRRKLQRRNQVESCRKEKERDPV